MFYDMYKSTSMNTFKPCRSQARGQSQRYPTSADCTRVCSGDLSTCRLNGYYHFLLGDDRIKPSHSFPGGRSILGHKIDKGLHGVHHLWYHVCLRR